MSTTSRNALEAVAGREYKWGFVSDIEADTLPPGLDEDVVRLISAKKQEPQFMLDWRLRAYRHWAKLERTAGEPRWANITYPAIDYQKIVFCSFSEAVQNHPELVQKYLGSVVPYTDNFYAALNSAVFSDGSFCYIPR